jgi:hypothetical protein
MKKLSLLFSIVLLFAGFILAQDQNPVKFSAQTFGDYFYNVKANTGTNNDLNGFDFRRIYFTTDYQIDPSFSAKFRLSSDETSNSNTAGGKLGVMVQDASLKWSNIFSGSNLVFGLSPTPAFQVSEAWWGHRYLEKTIMDLNGIVSSRDIGVDLMGKIDDGGMVKYWAKIGNNAVNGPETDKYKRYYGMLEFNPLSNLVCTVYGDYASAAKIYDKVAGIYGNNSAFVGALFLGYKQSGCFAVGAEGFIKSQPHNYAITSTSTLKTQNGDGISIFGYANLTDKIQVVARYDGFDPNTANSNATSVSDAKGLILAGLQFAVSKTINITPNIEITKYQVNPTSGGYSQDVVPRITFDWEVQ